MQTLNANEALSTYMDWALFHPLYSTYVNACSAMDAATTDEEYNDAYFAALHSYETMETETQTA